VEKIIESEWVVLQFSADTGAFSSGELNAIQRSNPEMQNVLLMPSVDW
jgi:hypothetical protein